MKRSFLKRFWWIMIPMLSIAFAFLFANNVFGVWTKLNKLTKYRTCQSQMEGLVTEYNLVQKGDGLYLPPKPTSGKLIDLQKAGYMWDEASEIIVADKSKEICYKGKSSKENHDYFYCNSLGYYAKIPLNDKEYIKGSREMHNYLIDLILAPTPKDNIATYNVVSCYAYENGSQL